MWTPLLLCLIVAAAANADSVSPWKANAQYRYAVRGRTLTGLHQVANQYAGVVMKATANIQQKPNNILSVQISGAQFAEILANMSHGWSSPIPESQLHYQQMPLSDIPFELKYENGAISGMVVSKDVPTWELNILKSIATQLQVDTQAKNLKKSRVNSLPAKNAVNGIYKTMEDSVSGKCETLYDISPLPKVVLLNKPELAPLPQLQVNGQLIDIRKTMNFSNCDVPSAYHFGITGLTDWEPASNQMGAFLARSSMSRVVISGNLQRYTIQSSVTTSKVIASPFLYDKQNGIVVSSMNLTLIDVKSASGSPQSPPNPANIKSLVYEYEPASPQENKQGPDRNQQLKQDTPHLGSGSSPSSSDSNSSESQEQSDQNIVRARRSLSESNEDQNDQPSINEDEQNARNRPIIYKKESSSSSDSDSDSSSSSSFSWDMSEEENWQERPSLNQPPSVPFDPVFIANKGNSIQSAKEMSSVAVLKKISQQIGSEVQTPSAIPGQKTLTKFIIMTNVLKTMNAKQMEEATKELYYPLSRASSSSARDAEKYQAWAAYRDAVAESGTGPALLTIKEWIQSRKVQGEEAAQLLSVLPDTAMFPNLEYMNTFFELAKSSAVKQQRFLNSSAALAFTDLARRAFVSNSTAHNRFPLHTFGPLKPKMEQPVVQQYIPYFAKALKEAVSQEDSINIRTYTMALGNLAHPRILNVFEPFLEGKEPMTHFQRLTIVAALSQLAKAYPKVARPVFFRIYQNTGEATEMRVAAVFQLMKTNPPAQMLQRMAQFTNDDQDSQVISAVQSAIRSAAYNLQSQDQELKMNAQSAVNLLNPIILPAQYSKMNLRSYYASELNLGYQQNLRYIGSDDGFLPSNLFYSLRRNLGGFQRQELGISAMSSSLDDLADLLEEQFDKPNNNKPSQSEYKQSSSSSSSGYSFNFDTIDSLLNIEPNEQAQVEGSLVLTTLVGNRLFAFDNHTVEQLPELVKAAAASLRSGESFNYTKIANKFKLLIGFPTAMGLPFYFSLHAPTLLYVGGEARAQSDPDLASGNDNQIQPPRTVNASIDLQFVYSSLKQSKMGFVTPFNRAQYVTGVNRNVQLNLPVRAQIDVDVENKKVAAKVEPLDQDSKQNLFEFSTEPYTSYENVIQLVQNPDQFIQEDGNNNMRIVHVRQPNQLHTSVGQESTGVVFDIDYKSEQKFIDSAFLFNALRKHDLISAAIHAWTEESTNFNNITVAYNPNKSSAKSARFTAAYIDNEDDNSSSRGKNYRNSERAGELGSGDSQRASPINISADIARPSSSSPDSQSRQQEFLEKASQGIQNSITKVVDVSAEFQGQSNAQYVATLAVAKSYVSAKSRLLFFAEKRPADNDNQQIYVAAESAMPKVPVMNFEEALNTDPTSYFGLEMAYAGKSSPARIQMMGQMKQSQARLQSVKQSPMAQLCKQQMQQGNTVQYACRNVTSQANLLNQYQLSVQFENVPDSWKNATYKAYSILRYAAIQYASEDLISPNNPSNKIDLEANIAPDLKSLNISIDSPLLSAEFNNIRLNRYFQAVLPEHPEYNAAQRLAQEIFRGDQFPTCVVDNSMAETFDNATYPIVLGNCWHAMLHYVPKEDPSSDSSSSSNESDDDDEISILVRDSSSSNEKEVMVVIGDNSIHMTPTPGDSPANVKINGQQVQVSKSSLSQHEDENGETLVQMYADPAGAVRMFYPQQDIEVQYDGSAVKVKAQNSYRSEIRGLCGTFNSQPSDDFTTPQNCVLQNPLEFAGSYALDDSSCQGPAKEYKQKAQQRVSSGQCYRNNVIYGNVVADQQREEPLSSSNSHNKRPRSSQTKNEQYSAPCSEERIQVRVVDEKDCFSVQPQAQCVSPCQAQHMEVKQLQFVCFEPSALTQQWKASIKLGANPSFSQKNNIKNYFMQVPSACTSA